LPKNQKTLIFNILLKKLFFIFFQKKLFLDKKRSKCFAVNRVSYFCVVEKNALLQQENKLETIFNS
jgi:hypothetical protein